jgi:peptidoglycan/xylan/chitin deacetylase (PgdA/CDA1 family)
MIFVTSWDDGQELDMRVADLLVRHGIKGTFYIPVRNCEGREVMSHSLMKELDAQFDVGGHTMDHVFLTTINESAAVEQVVHGKIALEEILGHYVEGFCYPGGKVSSVVRASVVEAGFHHARTTRNLWTTVPRDKYMLPTTVQFYPHRRSVILRNFVRWGHYGERFPVMSEFVVRDWMEAMRYTLERVGPLPEHVFHLWGHSWEVEEHGLWEQLDDLLGFVSAMCPVNLTVNELAEGF